jgi:hypothetical protein
MLSKVAGSLVYFLLVIFFIRWLPNHPEGILGLKYNPDFGVGYVFVANLIQSIITLLIVGKNSSVLAFRNLISVYGKDYELLLAGYDCRTCIYGQSKFGQTVPEISVA